MAGRRAGNWQTTVVKLIKQTTLNFRQGSSDKVYEVDLCEVADGQFVVNFRYGRRGTALREGSKTASPVSREQAEAIFDSLVNSKTSKGYVEGATPQPQPATHKPVGPADAASRDQAILKRIEEGFQSSSSWRLSRAIWRAGELKLLAAEPKLHPLVGREEMTDYCIAWTMGRLGQNASVPILEQIVAQTSNRDHVRQMATQAMRLVADETQRKSLVLQAVESMPEPLQSFLKNGSDDAFYKTFLDGMGKQYPADLLNALYYIDNTVTRRTLIEALKTIPLSPPFFRPVRRLLKAAELRRDGQVFGLIAYRFEKEKASFRPPSYYWRNYQKPTLGENPQKSFGLLTRGYLRRRVWRVLQRLGEVSDPDFVPMAVGTLLPFSDGDAQPVFTTSRYDWRERSWSQVHRDSFGNYWALNRLLYEHSARFLPAKTHFRVAPGVDPGSTPPEDVNEAAFPELWHAQPRGLLHLLTDSRCLPVHQFAAPALKRCKDFCKELPIPVVAILLQTRYEVTNRLGLELARERYNPSQPDFELVLALAQCPLQLARDQARQWVESNRTKFFGDTNFAYQIFTSEYSDTRKLGTESLHALPKDTNAMNALTGRLVAFAQGATAEQEAIVNELAVALSGRQFQPALSRLSEQVICDLLASELESVQKLAGSIVLNHDVFAREPTEKILRGMLDAQHASVRSMAIQIISELPDDVLRRNSEMLAGLICHPLEDVRNEVRPLVKRLSDNQQAFGEQIATILIRRLLTPGAPEGVPSHTSRVLRDDLGNRLSHVPRDVVWQLLRSRSGPAQEVGACLLPTHIDPTGISVIEIVGLANHAVVKVRQAAWQMYESQDRRMRAELSTAMRILDSNWDDSRQFGFGFFEKVDSSELTPEVLISICDSVREDVQQFGRKMIMQRFRPENGPEYLVKLSEHPSADLQLFTSNFLVEHAKDNPDRIQQLSPYFVSILSRVNQSRVAKDRVLDFLQTEATKDPATATTVAKILSRISATCAIGDRARSIEAMLDLHETYPEVELPIKTKPVEVR